MIMKKVLAAAKPYLAQKTISDLVVGLSLMACQLDNNDIGLSYVMGENLRGGCWDFAFFQDIIGRPALEVANYIISGDNDLQRALGAAVLTAASSGQPLPEDNIKDLPFGVKLSSDDIVGMVGYIKPVAREISKSVKKLIVFDRGKALDTEDSLLFSMTKQKELLPQCDLVIITGTATINGTIDSLLELCPRAREIIILGPSTPMYARGWQDSSVTRLAGSTWDKNHKDEIFKRISLAGGIASIRQYMHKKVMAVK